MKKIALTVCLLMLAGIFSACGAGQIADMVSQAAEQGDAAEASQEYEDEAAPDIGNPGMVVSTESDTVAVGGNLSWPAAEMGDIPEMQGTITAVVSADGCGTVTYKDITKDEAAGYLSTLKSLGYSGTEAFDDTMLYFGGVNSKGASVVFECNYETGEAYIAYTPAA